jgi:hypothetical protein
VTINASEVDRVVARWGFGEPGRGRRIVLASRAGRQLVLACLGRLQQSMAKFPIGGGRLLSLQSQWWKSGSTIFDVRAPVRFVVKNTAKL